MGSDRSAWFWWLRRRVVPTGVAVALLSGIASGVAPSVPAASMTAGGRRPDAAHEGAATCGKSGLTDCPLQGWMKETLGAAKAAPWDFGRLEGGFRKCAALAPKESGWTADWSALSIAGADAAKRSDKDGVSKACADCHAKFRKAYRESYRDRPLPR